MVSERPRGILSPADREYLANPDSRSRQAKYKRQDAIVERTRQSFHDFRTLHSSLPGELRKEAFTDDYDEDAPPEEMQHVFNSLPYVFAFLYEGIRDTNRSPESPVEVYEDFIASGLRQALNKEGTAVRSIDVTIDIEQGEELEELAERDDLTYPEVKQLLEGGEITPEEYLQLSAKALGADEDSLSVQHYDYGESHEEWIGSLEMDSENDETEE